MGINVLRESARLRVKARREARPLAQLRRRSADLPPPRNDLRAYLRPEPPPAPPEPDATVSRFSLEALIHAELAAGPTAPPVTPLVWALQRSRRAPRPHRGHGDPHRLPPGFEHALALRARGYLLWTEPEVMGGEDDDLPEARRLLASVHEDRLAEERRGPHGPVLPEEVVLIRGDLTLEPYQVFEAHHLGADGFLVFPELISIGQLEEVVGYGRELGLSPIALIWSARHARVCQEVGLRAVALSSGDPFGTGALTSRALFAQLGALRSELGDVPVTFGYAPRARPRRLVELAEAGATGIISAQRAPALLATLRGEDAPEE